MTKKTQKILTLSVCDILLLLFWLVLEETWLAWPAVACIILTVIELQEKPIS